MYLLVARFHKDECDLLVSSEKVGSNFDVRKILVSISLNRKLIVGIISFSLRSCKIAPCSSATSSPKLTYLKAGLYVLVRK